MESLLGPVVDGVGVRLHPALCLHLSCNISRVVTKYIMVFFREYDKCLLEVGKIFSIVQDYKNAREIESFAKEGKRKLTPNQAN